MERQNAKGTKMLKLTHFCEQYDIPKSNAIEWVHSKGFPAYKLGRSWYVDIPKFEKWREQEHERRYKYA